MGVKTYLPSPSLPGPNLPSYICRTPNFPSRWSAHEQWLISWCFSSSKYGYLSTGRTKTSLHFVWCRRTLFHWSLHQNLGDLIDNALLNIYLLIWWNTRSVKYLLFRNVAFSIKNLAISSKLVQIITTRGWVTWNNNFSVFDLQISIEKSYISFKSAKYY